MLLKNLKPFIASKVSVYGVFLVFIQSEHGRIQTRKTQNTDTFCTGFSAWSSHFRTKLLRTLEFFSPFFKPILISGPLGNKKRYHVQLSDLSLVFMAPWGVKGSRKRSRYVRNAIKKQRVNHTIIFFFKFVQNERYFYKS